METQYDLADLADSWIPDDQVADPESDDDVSSDDDSDDSDDSDYVPVEESSDSSSTCSDECDMENFNGSDETGNQEPDKYLVFDEQLNALFKFCSSCGSPVVEKSSFTRGTMLAVRWVCQANCSGTWYSQPTERAMPLGNLLVAGAILFCGGQYQKFSEFAKLLHLPWISSSTFYTVQESYLFPVIEQEYDLQQTALLVAFSGESVYVMGDGQCDSPGYNAKYCTYTLVEEETDLIVASCVISVAEVKNSNAMETEGLHRALKTLDDYGVQMTGLATDRHPQVTKYMRTQHAEMEHQFEIFHTAKGVNKKLTKVSKKRSTDDVLPWIQAISNMMWWACATCQESEKVYSTTIILYISIEIN